eukprot:16445601-Heterocapsa_arctica.AAC.1
MEKGCSKKSLAEMEMGCSSVRGRALNDIRAIMQGLSKKDRAGPEFITLAVSGKKVLSAGGFDKFIKM